MERQTERQVQKQSRPTMYFTANDHTTVYNVKLPVTQRIFNISQNATHRRNLKFHLYQQVKYNPVWKNLFRRKKSVFFKHNLKNKLVSNSISW